MSTTPIHAARHEGKVAIVTGAASGIGRATAQRLVVEGAIVLGCDLAAGPLEELAGERLLVEVADITDEAAVQRVVGRALEAFGRIDVLANVAGVMDDMLAAHELDDATFERVLRVNLEAPMRLVRAVLPTMRQQGRGAIVNVASEAGIRGGAAGFAYTTSKHGLIGSTRSVAWAYGPEGVRCNAVLPGGVATGIGSSMQHVSEWGIGRVLPVVNLAARIAEADELAAVISWLASDEAGYVNGALVTADGGWSAG